MGDPAPWQTTAMSYTLSGKLETATDPDQQTTTTTYDSLDRVASQVDAKGQTTQFLYTPRGNLERTLDPTGQPSKILTYTPNGQVATVTDANGHTTTFQYDGFDRLDRTVFANGTFELLAYDAASNVVSKTLRSGQSILFQYDALGRVFSKSPPDDSVIIFGYDRMGRLTSEFQAGGATTFQYDALGRLIAKTDRNFRTVAYQYDGAGNRIRLTYPNGHFITYEYDELNRLRRIRDAGVTEIVAYGYDSLSRRTSTTRRNGTATTQVWELDDDLGSLTHQLPGGPATWTCGYDAVHNRTSTSISAAQFNFDLTQIIPATYASNVLNQYTRVTLGTPSGDGSGSGDGNTPIGPGQRPTPPIGLGYDVQGNLSSALFDVYTHDAQNRLVEATRSTATGESARYFYDDAGNRVRKTVDGVTTQFVLDGNQLLEEYDGQGQLLRRYVHAGLDEPVRMNTLAGAEFYYHQDGLGSVVALTNASGFLVETYAYGPYGETGDASAVSNPFRYTGREFDAETGLYYYRARYYSPGIGRFLEPDPIGFGDGLNVYAYVGNNPINFVDPLGLFATGQSGFGGGGLAAPSPASAIVNNFSGLGTDPFLTPLNRARLSLQGAAGQLRGVADARAAAFQQFGGQDLLGPTLRSNAEFLDRAANFGIGDAALSGLGLFSGSRAAVTVARGPVGQRAVEFAFGFSETFDATGVPSSPPSLPRAGSRFQQLGRGAGNVANFAPLVVDALRRASQ